MQADCKEVTREDVIKSKNIVSINRLLVMYGKYFVLNSRGQKFPSYPKKWDSPVRQDAAAPSLKWVHTLHLVMESYVCPGLSKCWAITSNEQKTSFGKMTQHFRDPAPVRSSNHSLWDEEATGSRSGPPTCTCINRTIKKQLFIHV